MQAAPVKTGKQGGFCFACSRFNSDSLCCSRCKVANYCDASCQEQDWSRHKGFCKKGDIEGDLASFRDNMFGEIINYLSSSTGLESTTAKGTKPGLLKVTTKAIPTLDNSTSGVKVLLRQDPAIVKQMYPQGFQPGHYFLEINRSLLLTLIRAVRTSDGIWQLQFANDGRTTLLQDLQTNIKVMAAVSKVSALKKQLRKGDFNSNFFNPTGELNSANLL